MRSTLALRTFVCALLFARPGSIRRTSGNIALSVDGALEIHNESNAQPDAHVVAAGLWTAAFNSPSARTISLRGNSEVKLCTLAGRQVVIKKCRKTSADDLALFAAEAAMAKTAAQKGIGCPVHFTNTLVTNDTIPMIVMEPMKMGCGDAIKAGANPAKMIDGLVALFGKLKQKRVFWNDATSPNNIMTDSTLEAFNADGVASLYFIDFGTPVATAADYNRMAESYRNTPVRYDHDVGNWWMFLTRWVNEGINYRRDMNKTLPGMDPATFSHAQSQDRGNFVRLSSVEWQNLRNFKQAMQTRGLWNDIGSW